MVRVYRQPDERLSTQRPERLTRTFNYTLEQWNRHGVDSARKPCYIHRVPRVHTGLSVSTKL